MMKIAHINMFYYPTFGGVEKVMQELAERQVQKGHEVHVFCCDSDKCSRIRIKEETINGVRIHRYPYWFKLSLFTFIWPSLLWKLPKYKFDIVHTHVSGHLYILLTGIVSRIKKFRHIHTTHCPWTDSKFRPFILRPLLFLNDLIFNRISFSMIDKVIAITPWEIPILKKFIKESKIEVIPNGMDDILFKRVNPNNFKKKNNLHSPLILFFGRLNPTKGPEVLAKAAVELTKEEHNINFVWVGPDEGKANEVISIIKDYKNMKYLSPIRDKKNIAEMYQAADIYVLPSYREGLPLTLFEAMASGLPIIASPVNGVPFEMKELENGLFVQYGDVEGLKKAILKLLNDKKLSKKISENNIKKSKQYNWNIIYKRYMDEYQKLF